MYLIENKGGAIAIILLAIIFGGSFSPAMLCMERRGRLPQHIYLDYSITNFLVAVLIAVTVGQIGESKPGLPNFFTQLLQIQDNWPSVLFATAGGIALSLGNMICQYAWAFVGLSLANVIVCCMVVVLGTTVNYFLDGRINRAEILFPGVVCFVIAVLLGAAVNSSNAKDKKEKLRILGGDFSTDRTNGDIEINRVDVAAKGSQILLSVAVKWCTSRMLGTMLIIQIFASTISAASRNVDPEDENASHHAKPGTAAFLAEVEKRRSIKVAGSSSILGLGIVIFAGGCFFSFSPAFSLATNDQWHVLKKGVPHLVVYTAFFYFYLSGFVLAIGVNVWLLYRPIAGVPASTIGAYLKDWNGRHWALLSGLLCGFCNAFQFMGGQAAGFATADAVMASPLVCTFWDIVIFGEYRRSSRKTYLLLTSMLTMFVIAIGVLWLLLAIGKTLETDVRFIKIKS